MVQGDGVTATSDQLSTQPPVNVQGKPYNLLAVATSRRAKA
jgi:hypothetical protein